MIKSSDSSEFDFTLVLSGLTDITDEAVEALFTHGCDDATISVRSRRVYATFSRIAPSLREAILSAIHDIKSAGIGADVLRVDEFNLVSQAEIARRSGRSRQQINQFIQGTRGPGGFPPPVCRLSDDYPLWHWCEVARWLWDNDMVKEDVYRQAAEIELINNVLEFRRLRHQNPSETEGVLKAVES